MYMGSNWLKGNPMSKPPCFVSGHRFMHIYIYIYEQRQCVPNWRPPRSVALPLIRVKMRLGLFKGKRVSCSKSFPCLRVALIKRVPGCGSWTKGRFAYSVCNFKENFGCFCLRGPAGLEQLLGFKLDGSYYLVKSEWDRHHSILASIFDSSNIILGPTAPSSPLTHGKIVGRGGALFNSSLIKGTLGRQPASWWRLLLATCGTFVEPSCCRRIILNHEDATC